MMKQNTIPHLRRLNLHFMISVLGHYDIRTYLCHFWYHLNIILRDEFYIDRFLLDRLFGNTMQFSLIYSDERNITRWFMYLNENCNCWYQTDIRYISKLTHLKSNIWFTSFRWFNLTLPGLNYNPILNFKYLLYSFIIICENRKIYS